MREATIVRKTKETDIFVKINLDGTGTSKIDTKIGFFNHMLEAFSRHSLIDMEIKCDGDIDVDSHHSIEDVGIAIGSALKEAIGDKKGICRYGFFLLPMDEALVQCALDFSGRGFLVYNIAFSNNTIGGFDTEMLEEFSRALAYNAGINLNLSLIDGSNSHHIAEAAFKSMAKSLRMAVSLDLRDTQIPSTKGMI